MYDGMPDPVSETYRGLLQQLDTWFAESAARYPNVIPCRSGCSACCYGPFDISVADAFLVRQAYFRLPSEERARVRAKAEVVAGKMKEIVPDWVIENGLEGISEETFDQVCDALAAEPCPLLNEENNCRIYADRPTICRMMGLGIVTPAGRIIENGCPIQDQFPGYSTLPPQLLQLEAFEELETACLESASVALFGTPQRAHFETTIPLLLALL
jgi:Fe-S-cluster containining protein